VKLKRRRRWHACRDRKQDKNGERGRHDDHVDHLAKTKASRLRKPKPGMHERSLVVGWVSLSRLNSDLFPRSRICADNCPQIAL
jgi:hypothetical protein